jgi:hypothetical protein
MNNHLVPEVRPDVNGKLVTRHVKSGAASPSTTSLPAPPSLSALAANYVSNVESLTEAIDSAIDTGAYDEVEIVQKEVLCNTLQNMQPHVVEAYRRQIDDTPDIGYEDLLISVLANKLPSETAGYILFMTQQSASARQLDNAWDDDVQGTLEYETAFKVFRGVADFLTREDMAQPKDILKAEGQTLQDISAITSMLKIGHEKGVPGIYGNWDEDVIAFEEVDLGVLAIDYPKDIEHIVELMTEHSITDVSKARGIMELQKEYPESFERIVAIMDERNTHDLGIIRGVLDAEVQPLSNGIL